MANRFWNPSADANWGDANVWATTFNGDPTGVATPTQNDDCFFTATNSHKCTIGANANCHNLYFDNADNGGHGDWVGTIQDNGDENELDVYGGVALSAAMSFLGGFDFYLIPNVGTNIIRSNGNIFESMSIEGAGTCQLQDNLSITYSLNIIAGTFDANGHNVSASSVSGYAADGYPVVIKLGSGIWTLTGTGTIWSVANNTYTVSIIPSTSTIKSINTSNSAVSFVGNGFIYNNIYFSRGASTGSITITGSNTFNDFKDDGTAAHSIKFPNSTTTVATFSVNGTSGNLISLTRTGASGQFTLSAPSGTISCNYIEPSNSIATGGATWNAYTANGSVDGGGNTGWNFTAPVVYTMDCVPASFAFTPQPQGENMIRKMACLPASFTFTGMSTNMHRILTMACSPATYTYTGMTMAIKRLYGMICLPAQYIFTGLSTVITVPLHSTWNTIVRNTSSWNIVVRNITNWIKKSQGQ